MASVSIRDLDDGVRDKLRIRAARNGRSMEAEMREILTAAVDDGERSEDLFSALIDRFGALGGVDLDLPAREGRPRPAEW